MFAPAIVTPVKTAVPSHVVFSRPFAPTAPTVSPAEKPYRSEICLNGLWRFQPEPIPTSFKQDSGVAPDLPAPTDQGWVSVGVKVPSPWNVNAFNQGDGGDFRCYPSYPKSWNDTQMGWLTRTVKIPTEWAARRTLLKFDAIAGAAEVIVNGHVVGHDFDLFLPAEYDITQSLIPGQTNTILVGIRKASLFNHRGTVGTRPYPGGSMWGQAIVGIWQDVVLQSVPVVRVSDDQVSAMVSKDTLRDTATVRNDSPADIDVQVSGQIVPWVNDASQTVQLAPEPKFHLGKPVLTFPTQTLHVPAGQSTGAILEQQTMGKLRLWSPDTPNLYCVVVTIRRSGVVVDRHVTRFGWREFTFHGNHQFLNGKPLELRGDSWHFLGIPQMTRRYAWAWFRALKDAHGNAARLHAQPYPSFYLDMADEMGICVLDETAIWGSDAGHAYEDPAFWTRSDDHVRRLVLRDRNHATVFGWSVSNEVAWYIGDQHPALMQRLKDGWRTWRQTAETLDPTRPWISTDGDNDASGIMPTSVSHYTSPKDIVRANMPFGEGETGGAYFGSPKYASQFAGPRAYESQQGRMEGIAREAYSLIQGQRAVGASYVSVFNLVWYGLKPLALGMADTSRPPTLSDGIVFPAYRNGVRGVQPERLGPYSTTLNPGYDPKLPLYQPWPLADSIRAAYGLPGPLPSPWDHFTPIAAKAIPIPASIDQVAMPVDDRSELPLIVRSFGATIASPDITDAAKYIVIDGSLPRSAANPSLGRQISERVRAGATCLVLEASASGLSALNAILPVPVQITNRDATSLVIKSADKLFNGLDNSDFYFTELATRPVVQHGLAGPLVAKGRVLLAASPTDWSRWNNVAEIVKTGATLRSEREAKPSGAVLVEYKLGQGRYLVSTLDLSNLPTEVVQTVRRMMANDGVKFTDQHVDSSAALDFGGVLTQALVCGNFTRSSLANLYSTDFVGIGPDLKPTAGSISNGRVWKVVSASPGGTFNFKTMGLPGPTETAAVYLSFWLWSPRTLDNLLVEPNMPTLDLLMGSDDGCQVWLNSKQVTDERGIHPVTRDAIVAKSLPIQRGWNSFVIKVVQGMGEWGYTARFRSSSASFLLGLRSAVSAP